jgi:hypothetical protein
VLLFGRLLSQQLSLAWSLRVFGLEAGRTQRDRGQRPGDREEVVTLLMYLQFPGPLEHICLRDIDTVVQVVSVAELKE